MGRRSPRAILPRSGGTPGSSRRTWGSQPSLSILEVRHIDAHYGRIQALRDVTLDLDAGEIAALIGANGAGKTTTLRTISGLMHPSSGTIAFGGQDITHMQAARV